MKVFTDTNYREHGAGDLVNYLDKENGLQNRSGEQMSDEEIETFIEKSEAYGFERQIIISPEQGDQLSDQELSQYTRQVMSEFCTDRQTATYCYAIHRDTEHPHTQVAVTGTKRDLWMDTEDCDWLRERATEQFHDHHRELTKELSHQLEEQWARDLDPEQQAQHTREQQEKPTHGRPHEAETNAESDHDPGRNHDTVWESDTEPEQKHTHDQSQERGP